MVRGGCSFWRINEYGLIYLCYRRYGFLTARLFDAPLDGTGFVITRKTDTPLTACTYITAKWPQTTPQDKVVLRVFMGKPGDNTVQQFDGETLKELAVKEIQRIMKFSAKPLWVELTRLDKSMPQYKVGHRDLVARLKDYAAKAYPAFT